MYRRPWMKFLIALGSVCAAFAMVCCIIAFVRIFRASREVANSQKTLEARKEELEEIKKDVKKTARRQEKEAEKRRQRADEVEKAFQEEEPQVTVQPSPSPTPTPASVASANKGGTAASGNQQPEGILSSNQEEGRQTASGVGHVVGIDPGHQGPQVDMSDTEPNGPGSGEMKAKATSGTSGAYSGLGEYQLNLDVSLKLQQILQERGYQTVMARTDNDTAISNAQRALLAAENGAEIYVRIHANGSEDHGVQGALSMSPSQSNPYIPELYEDSLRLSQSLLDAYCAATNFENRGVQFTDTMTGINWSRVPVTILEMGFMTNEHDDLAMADEGFQQTMAEGIADGIDAYFAQ